MRKGPKNSFVGNRHEPHQLWHDARQFQLRADHCGSNAVQWPTRPVAIVVLLFLKAVQICRIAPYPVQQSASHVLWIERERCRWSKSGANALLAAGCRFENNLGPEIINWGNAARSCMTKKYGMRPTRLIACKWIPSFAAKTESQRYLNSYAGSAKSNPSSPGRRIGACRSANSLQLAARSMT